MIDIGTFKAVEITSEDQAAKVSRHSGWCLKNPALGYYKRRYQYGKLFAIYRIKESGNAKRRPSYLLFAGASGVEFQKSGAVNIDPVAFAKATPDKEFSVWMLGIINADYSSEVRRAASDAPQQSVSDAIQSLVGAIVSDAPESLNTLQELTRHIDDSAGNLARRLAGQPTVRWESPEVFDVPMNNGMRYHYQAQQPTMPIVEGRGFNPQHCMHLIDNADFPSNIQTDASTFAGSTILMIEVRWYSGSETTHPFDDMKMLRDGDLPGLKRKYSPTLCS